MDKEKFGEFICKLRKEKGMTQQELGNKLHLTSKTISKWEEGLSFPDICILQDISQTLDVSVLELLNGERSIEMEISNETANKIIEGTVNHSEQLIKKLRRRLAITIALIIGLLPLLLMFFLNVCLYLVKDEKSLDDALLTLAFIIIAASTWFIMCSIPVLGFVFTKMWQNSSLMSTNKKLKRYTCIVFYFVFSIWIIATAIRIINNVI